MEGIYFNPGGTKGPSPESSAVYDLLAKQGNMEIMRMQIEIGDVIWLCPAEDPAAIEFFFVHKGGIELALDDGPFRLVSGDSFYIQGLGGDIPVKASAATELIYVTTCPIFDSVQHFQDSLKQLLLRINEKDHYTYRHSANVMHYSHRLYDALKAECGNVTIDDILIASLFHDVGKCFVPDEILKKKGKLEREEMRAIYRHPIDSARLLGSYFGEAVAEIAGSHHERLDGSGYPRGYAVDDISFAARIVAVADVFDAMTTVRGYNRVKSYAESAEALYSLDEQFDRRITLVLRELVRSGEIQRLAEGGTDEQA